MRRTILLAGNLVFTLGALLFFACSSDDDSPTGPEKACQDTADRVAKRAVDCGLGSYADTKSSFESAVGGCSNIVSVRDEAELRDVCFPTLDTLSCSDLENGVLDESCKGQLLRNASLPPEDVTGLIPASFVDRALPDQ